MAWNARAKSMSGERPESAAVVTTGSPGSDTGAPHVGQSGRGSGGALASG